MSIEGSRPRQFRILLFKSKKLQSHGKVISRYGEIIRVCNAIFHIFHLIDLNFF